MTNVTLRPYRHDTDMAALSAIWLEASRRAHAFLGEKRLLEQKNLVEEIYLPKAETTVALLDGQPLGFLSLLGDHVGGLFIAPEIQGRGIGRRLIEAALTRFPALHLNVYTDNPQAFGFYRRLGFTEQSRSPEDDEGLPFEVARLRLVRENYLSG